MRLTVTGGPQSVELKLKGSGRKKLKAAEKTVLALLAAAEVQARKTPMPFGFSVASETQLAELIDEEDDEEDCD